jgi:hypothetical protein
MTQNKMSCWTCAYQKIGGPTFLGVCTYFSTIGKPNKDIPPGVVDVGCKQWKARPPKVDPPLEDPDPQ